MITLLKIMNVWFLGTILAIIMVVMVNCFLSFRDLVEKYPAEFSVIFVACTVFYVITGLVANAVSSKDGADTTTTTISVTEKKGV